MVDALGNPTGFFLTGGEAHDLKGADHLLPTMEADTLIADKAFDADARVLEPLAAVGKIAVIPPRTNLSSPREYDRELYAARHLIENFFAKIKQFSRHRHPLREDRTQLPRCRPARRQRRLAQLMTGPRVICYRRQR